MNGIIRADGSPKFAMFATLIGALLNIVLDPIAIFIFNLGVKGAYLSNEITKIYGQDGLKEDTIKIHATGNAGNSFGAFLTIGVTLDVTGDANDYLGKGLCGGKIIIKPSKKATFDYATNIICGNVALYGATSGECYLEGIAGERKADRRKSCRRPDSHGRIWACSDEK